MILSRFQWYRRARGGYWAQVTASLGIFSRTRWVRCKGETPTADREWTFYPWAQKRMGNGYIDEWYSPDGIYATPLSSVICKDCKGRLAKATSDTAQE